MSATRIRCKLCDTGLQIMKRCTRCLKIYYWECQIKHWSIHKSVCIPAVSKGQTAETETPGNTINPAFDEGPSVKELPRGETGDSEENRKTGAGHSYMCNDTVCFDVPQIDSSLPVFQISVIHNKQKEKVSLRNCWSGEQVWKYLSSVTSIPVEKLQLIHKGKKLEQETVHECIKDKAVILALGEKALLGDGCHSNDIMVLMRQLNIDRNSAIKALQKTGNLVDAILDIGKR